MASLHRRGRLSSAEIVHAAANSFYAHGYSDTTLADVARQLHVTDKAIYYYFDSKDELYLQTLELCIIRIAGEIGRIGQTVAPGLDKIKIFVRSMIAQPENLRLYIRGLPKHLENTEEGQRIRAAETAHDEILIGWIEAGMADGSIQPGNPKMLWKWIQGGLVWLDVWSRRESDGGVPARHEAEAMAMLDRSLRSAAAREAETLADQKHWLRNTLATVQGLASQTAAHSGSTEEFETAFNGRLSALTRGRCAVLNGNWTPDLQHLVEDAVRESGPGCVCASGPAVPVAHRATAPLNMMLHELATNAVRHGALSRENGRVDVTWKCHRQGAVRLTWQESGGPAVLLPAREGLGTSLVRQFAEYELGGYAAFDFRPEGLRTELAFANSCMIAN